MIKPLSILVLISLVAGLALGAFVQQSGNADFVAAAGVLKAFGDLWLNALRMTVVPLVFSLLVVGVASVSDAAKTGGLVLRAVLLFTLLLVLAAIYAIALTNGVLDFFPVDRESAQALIAGAGASAPEVSAPPTFAEWLAGLAPSNPVGAAADEKMVPLVVFALFFGFAATRLPAHMHGQIVTLFRAVSEAMIVIVHWVLLAGPIGVFCLALGVGVTAGFGAAGTIFHYVAVVTGVLATMTVIGWLIAITFGRQPIGRFTAAITPVWVIALSTQSSLASLPAMITAAREGLRLPERVVDVTLPLAVAVFRFTSPVGNLAVCFFIAHLYGIQPTFLHLVGGVAVAYAMSIGAVGLPGQVSYISSIAPICMALGVPIELLGIFIAVEVIPDLFRTTGNVTGDVAAASILAGGERETMRAEPRSDEASA
ncbi:dicarboxylate/amino acid:cation symporter [Terricaulis sp.]|uniref:dicarboxylate/amino acid:cation symporter n=1 Tax=Terricaulis sp. TaxID=2768686 RepID=UPI0037849DAB